MSENQEMPKGRTIALGTLVFFGGFAVMVLEIAGARYLQPYFGGAFYVWTSQIGVVMLALALGYAVGGRLADRWKRAHVLGAVLVAAGIFILLISKVAPGVLDGIIDRHAQVTTPAETTEMYVTGPSSDLLSELPSDFMENETEQEAIAAAPEEVVNEIPAIWQKLDPAMGSGVVFLFPCFALAMITPYIIRLAAHKVANVGTLSGTVYAASTAGSIGGVFVTAYLLIDLWANTQIFFFTGLLTSVWLVYASLLIIYGPKLLQNNIIGPCPADGASGRSRGSRGSV